MNRRKFLKKSLQYISGILLYSLPLSLLSRKKRNPGSASTKEAYFYKKKYN